MSIIPVTKDDIESFDITTNPIRHYSSSSNGVTGSVYVFARRSAIEKSIAPTDAFIDATHDDADINAALQALVLNQRDVYWRDYYYSKYAANAPDLYKNWINQFDAQKIRGMFDDYFSKVDSQSIDAKKQKVLEIIRFTPSTRFTSNTTRKLVVKDILMNHYRCAYPSAHWAYTNYNTLNFFTSSTVPNDSVLLYPNVQGEQFHEGYVSGTYSLSGSFSFDFYINPRYKPDSRDGSFKAGTIFHLSSSYALSLVSGSAKDQNGRSIGYRLQLQLSHSADVPPSSAVAGTYPSDLIFLSDDNSLQWNKWHHVVVRWGTNLTNKGTGSFNIDGIDKGIFVVPSGTISPRLSDVKGNPDVLCIGNYYEGTNTGFSSQALFFANNPATRDGIENLVNVPSVDLPDNFRFQHPLNAELHDLSIKRYYMSDDDIQFSSSVGPKSIDSNWVCFYLPPFFVEDSPFRKWVGDHGGIPQTPFFEIDGTTKSPFNVAMSFGVNGHYINIENYLRDFASNIFPRALNMTGSSIDHTTDARPANDFIYDDPQLRRRNTLILPCDDGLFVPSYDLLASESNRSSMIGDDGIEDLSYVHLDNLLSTASLLFGTTFENIENTDATSANQFVDESIGFTPEQPGLQPGKAYVSYMNKRMNMIQTGTYVAGVDDHAPLTIYQRTRDASSNQVTFFDISNLYYGNKILPGSFVIKDSNITGSSGAMSITLKDDGYGNIYRADSFTSSSTWNSVGNIFYDEGIVLIKNPHLYFYGKDQYELSFRGEQGVHVLKLEVIADSNQINSSSNPNFKELSASGFITDTDPNFVYITNVNFHDKNLNVVAKTQLAQPIVKRHGDRLMIKTAIDF